MAGEAEMDTFF